METAEKLGGGQDAGAPTVASAPIGTAQWDTSPSATLLSWPSTGTLDGTSWEGPDWHQLLPPRPAPLAQPSGEQLPPLGLLLPSPPS